MPLHQVLRLKRIINNNSVVTNDNLTKDGENMKYKIAICDDSDADRQYVLNMVHAWAASAGHVVHTDTFTSAENFLFHYAE